MAAGSVFIWSRSTGTWVECLHQETEQELDGQLVVHLLDALFSALPDPALWIKLARIQYWSDYRTDKWQPFRDNPKTAGWYDYATNIIHLHGSRFLEDPKGILAHEVGHFMQDAYRLGTSDKDTLGDLLWKTHVAVAGNDDPEAFASNCGRVLLRRLGVNSEPLPRGFDTFLNYVRQVRA